MATLTTRQNLTDFDAVLKDVYEGVMRKQLNDEIIGFKLFTKKQANFSGRQIVFPVHVARTRAIGALPENGTLPTAQHQSIVQAKQSYTRNYLSIELTADVMKVSDSNEGAFAEALAMEMERGAMDLKKDMNRQCYNDGTGTLATVSGTPAATTATLTIQTGAGFADGTRYLSVGDKIDIHNSDNSTKPVAGAEITAVTSTQITISPALAANCLANARVKRAGSASNYASTYEMTGLQAIVDDGTLVSTLHNVPATTYPIWKATRDGTSTAVTVDLLQRKIDAVYRAGGSDIDVLLSDPSLRRDYVALTQSLIRYKPVDTKDVGFESEALQYTGGKKPIPYVTDIDCPFGKLFGITKSSIKFYSLADFEWADQDGSILLRASGRDAWQAFMRVMGDFGTDKRNANFVFTALSATSTD